MSIRKRATLLACAAGALALIAANPMSELDVDGDRKVSMLEFTASSMAKFDAADTNGDNRLDAGERANLRKNKRMAKTAKRFSRMDKNGDGVVTQAEMQGLEKLRMEARAKKKADILARFDADKDGRLNDAEKLSAELELKGGKYASTRKRRAAKRRNARLDIDRDGIIERSEYLAASDRLFNMMDVNGDGYLQKGEGKSQDRATRTRGR